MKEKLLFLMWVLGLSICLYGIIVVIPDAKIDLRLAESECAHARVEYENIRAELKSLQAACDGK